jgi:drug/metabolite transporter superfamily protein YnfA
VRREVLFVILSLFAFIVAALVKIVGRLAFWMWLRRGMTRTVAALGVRQSHRRRGDVARVDAALAGRAYVASGGVSSAASPSRGGG